VKILHITPHLGGGVGNAHAAMAPHMPRWIEQTFVLLTEPIDRRYVDAIVVAGGRIVVGSAARQVVSDADVLQIEYWDHPALSNFFDDWRAPFDRASVCWCHQSGLHQPLIPARLVDSVDRFVATSPITLSAISLRDGGRGKACVINSGFGFNGGQSGARDRKEATGITYLGTVGFKKLHAEFFSAIDAVAEWAPLGPVSVWGHVSPDVAAAAAAMRRPGRVKLRGQTSDPRGALSDASIFFYPLRRDHYGTGESALIEAMSLGLVPVVLDNPAEAAIVRHGETGLVVSSIEEAVAGVRQLAQDEVLRGDLSRNAARDVDWTRSPSASAAQFVALWRCVLAGRNMGRRGG
jgi:glycosyltransferase involved in cell wall biosynthesis